MRYFLLLLSFCLFLPGCSSTDPLAGKWEPVSALINIQGKMQEVKEFSGVRIIFHADGRYQSWDKNQSDEEGSWSRSDTELTTLTRSIAGEDKGQKTNKLKIEELTDDTLVLSMGDTIFKTVVTYKKIP
jgi:hypothetical protein